MFNRRWGFSPRLIDSGSLFMTALALGSITEPASDSFSAATHDTDTRCADRHDTADSAVTSPQMVHSIYLRFFFLVTHIGLPHRCLELRFPRRCRARLGAHSSFASQLFRSKTFVWSLNVTCSFVVIWRRFQSGYSDKQTNKQNRKKKIVTDPVSIGLASIETPPMPYASTISKNAGPALHRYRLSRQNSPETCPSPSRRGAGPL